MSERTLSAETSGKLGTIQAKSQFRSSNTRELPTGTRKTVLAHALHDPLEPALRIDTLTLSWASWRITSVLQSSVPQLRTQRRLVPLWHNDRTA